MNSETTTKTPIFTGIVVDDGSERVPIRNKKGEEIGEFYFRPTDIDIMDRWDKFTENFGDIVQPLGEVSIAPNGEAAEDSELDREVLAEAKKRLFGACDELFDGNMSEAFFGKMNPFSPVNGYFYCENALNSVMEYIGAQFDVEAKKIDKRVAKYTHGYKARTGKHKDGRK